MRVFVNRSILGWALGVAAATVVTKALLHHWLEFEPIEQTSVHNALVSSAIFVVGFVLAATISDYKESERIPADFAATVEDLCNDAAQLRKEYEFDLERFRSNLVDILGSFRHGTREGRLESRREIADLHTTFGQMHVTGVPPNFVTKLKAVSVPFREAGHTRDDVSLFLLRETRAYLESRAPAPSETPRESDPGEHVATSG